MIFDNNALREQIKAQRQSLSVDAQAECAGKILHHFINSKLFQQAERIGCYLSVKGEVETQAIIQQILQLGKQCYLPCLRQNAYEHLIFAEYKADTPLISNQYGIPEPPHDKVHCLNAENLDCVLVPLVAFDAEGNRLGMGAGYYDRSFAFNKTNEKPVPLIGLAYAFQEAENFLVQTWDIPLSGVVTEEGLRIYSPNV